MKIESIPADKAQTHLPLISISIPVLNEEANLNALYTRLCQLSNHMADRCNLEFVFTHAVNLVLVIQM